jgi:hypothetical protein
MQARSRPWQAVYRGAEMMLCSSALVYRAVHHFAESVYRWYTAWSTESTPVVHQSRRPGRERREPTMPV